MMDFRMVPRAGSWAGEAEEGSSESVVEMAEVFPSSSFRSVVGVGAKEGGWVLFGKGLG
jgi:hypothetical protein